MKIEIVSWRDPKNPKAGGAEVCLREISRRLIAKFGHSVSWFAPTFANSAKSERLDGIEIERNGFAGFIHFTALFRYLQRNDQDKDFYIEDYHGISLCTPLYLRKPSAILVHEVAGPIWFEMFSWPFSWFGFVLERIVLRFLRNSNFITVSESTKADLIRHGIPPQNIHVFTEASDVQPVPVPVPRRERQPQFVFVGRICKMKRVDLLLRAFAEFRKSGEKADLYLVGAMDPSFQHEFDKLTMSLNLGASVRRTGFVTQEDKAMILQTSIALVSCSMHEGFGLIVVEANSQGTAAITFDVNGYRDLVKPGVNGYLSAFGDVSAMSQQMIRLAQMSEREYDSLAASALTESRKYSWDSSADEFHKIVGRLASK